MIITAAEVMAKIVRGTVVDIAMVVLFGEESPCWEGPVGGLALDGRSPLVVSVAEEGVTVEGESGECEEKVGAGVYDSIHSILLVSRKYIP